MSRISDYDSVEPRPRKSFDERVSYGLGLFATALIAVGIGATLIGLVQYFNAEVVGVGRGTAGSVGAPGSDTLTALPPTLNAATLLTAMTAALTNVTLPRGAPGLNATCMCPPVRNGTDSKIPGPIGPTGPMGPVFYLNGTAPSTFSHITVVAGGSWTGGPVFDTITAGSAGRFAVNAAGEVQAAAFFAGSGAISTTGTISGKTLSLTGSTAQNSLQTQGGIQAVYDIATSTGSVSTAAASMSVAGVVTGTATQILGDVNGARGVFANGLNVGTGAPFSVNSTGGVSMMSLKTANAVLSAAGVFSCAAVTTPLASMSGSGAISGVTMQTTGQVLVGGVLRFGTSGSNIDNTGFVNSNGIYNAGQGINGVSNFEMSGNLLLDGTSSQLYLQGSNSVLLVSGASDNSITTNGGVNAATKIRTALVQATTSVTTPQLVATKSVTTPQLVCSTLSAGLISGISVSSSGTIATPLASMNAAGLISGTSVSSSGTIATPLASMNAAGVINGLTVNVSPTDQSTRKKIVMYNGLSNNYEYVGFGVNGNELTYNTVPGMDHKFYVSTGGTSAQLLFTIKTDGSGLVIESGALKVNNGVVVGAGNLVVSTGAIIAGGDADITYTCTWSAPASGMTGSTIRFQRKNGIVFVNIRGSDAVTGTGGSQIQCGGVTLDQAFRIVSSSMNYVDIPFTCVLNGIASGCFLHIGTRYGDINAIAYNNAPWTGYCQIYSSSGSYILEQ
jgi:hypothetical protein